MNPNDIEAREFTVASRGYDREEVDAFLRVVGAEVRRLQSPLAKKDPAPGGSRGAPEDAGSEAGPGPEPEAGPEPGPRAGAVTGGDATRGDATGGGEASPADPAETYRRVGDETARILVAAEQAAMEIKERGHRDAAEIIAAAREEALAVFKAAKAERGGLEDEIRQLHEARSLLGTEMEDMRRRFEELVLRLRQPFDVRHPRPRSREVKRVLGAAASGSSASGSAASVTAARAPSPGGPFSRSSPPPMVPLSPSDVVDTGEEGDESLEAQVPNGKERKHREPRAREAESQAPVLKVGASPSVDLAAAGHPAPLRSVNGNGGHTPRPATDSAASPKPSGPADPSDAAGSSKAPPPSGDAAGSSKPSSSCGSDRTSGSSGPDKAAAPFDSTTAATRGKGAASAKVLPPKTAASAGSAPAGTPVGSPGVAAGERSARDVETAESAKVAASAGSAPASPVDLPKGPADAGPAAATSVESANTPADAGSGPPAAPVGSAEVDVPAEPAVPIGDGSGSEAEDEAEETAELPPPPVDAQGALDWRDSVLGEMPSDAARLLKRLLQEDQGDLLERLRAWRGDGPAANHMPPAEEQVARFVKGLSEVLSAAFRGGRGAAGVADWFEGGDPAPVIDALVTKQLVTPLRRDLLRLLGPSSSGSSEKSPSATAASKRASDVYRVWKGVRTDLLGEGLVYAVFHQGLLDAVRGNGSTVRKEWVVSSEEGNCPREVCSSNASAGPVGPDAPFSSGHLVPPAHGGCTCTLLLVRH